MNLQSFFDLSEDETNRMERLAEAATVGPWLSYVVDRDDGAGWNRVELGICNDLGSFQSIELTGASIADQDFIAAARQDVPRLVREVRALRALVSSLRGEHDVEELPALERFATAAAASIGRA